jgi:hypothetical protein
MEVPRSELKIKRINFKLTHKNLQELALHLAKTNSAHSLCVTATAGTSISRTFVHTNHKFAYGVHFGLVANLRFVY